MIYIIYILYIIFFGLGYLGINQEQCESKGCCWAPSTDVSHFYSQQHEGPS